LRMAQLTTAAASLVGGFALRRGGHDAVVSRPTGRDGEDQQWTLFAVALEALLRAFVEPDPKSGP
ncbi:MAG TPA: hypothetical protein VKW77_03915, partial [Acidimicrobiales bacterium]|nr:hypothetical protein [Acidimicrobiales bacterium]